MNTLANSTLGRTFLGLAIFCMAILILLLGKPLLAPIALSFILAFVLTPVVRRLEYFGIGRLASVLLIVVSLTVVTVLLGAQLISQLNALVTELPQHREEIESKLASFRTGPDSPITQVVDLFNQLLGNAEFLASAEVASDVQRVAIVDEKSPIPWIASAPKLIADIIEPLASIVVVIVLVVYILISREDLRNRFFAVIGNRHLTSITTIVNESSSRMGNYLLGLVGVNFGFALCFGIVLYLLDVPYSAVWSAVTFVFRFVPLLGSFVSMLLPVSVSLLFMPGWLVPIFVIAFYLTLELITANLLEPWLFGKSVGMNPFALLIAIMFWTWAWGPIGLMMATPLTLILATLGRHIPYLRSFDFLLSDARPMPAHLVYFQRLLANDMGEAETLLRSVFAKRGLPFVVDKIGIRSMTHSDRELRSKEISTELHGLVGQRNDALLWKIVTDSEFNTVPKTDKAALEHDATNSTNVLIQKAFGISLGGERTNIALRVVAISCPKLELSLGHSLSPATSKLIAKEDFSVVVISALPTNPLEVIEAFARRLRSDGFTGWIAVGNWRVKSLDSTARRRLKEAGVDYASHRLHSLCRILKYAEMSN
jgi:predicted PurR-regulated permease PerM